jgi:hypothetical protein
MVCADEEKHHPPRRAIIKTFAVMADLAATRFSSEVFILLFIHGNCGHPVSASFSAMNGSVRRKPNQSV